MSFEHFLGVATFCRDAFMPCKAEEGLAGTLPSSNFKDSIGYYGYIENEFSWTERKELDSEGRSVLTQHEVQVRTNYKARLQSNLLIELNNIKSFLEFLKY